MAKKLDESIAMVLRNYGFDASACWDCHGTWVVYHKVLEQIAAQAGIEFEQPYVINSDIGNKMVAVCVTGSLGERSEWSIGEAAPYNNKNTYPYAMAEKRAKDRVILKLIGLTGLAYSEDEADDFKEAAPPGEKPKSAHALRKDGAWEKIIARIDAATDTTHHDLIVKEISPDVADWSKTWKTELWEYCKKARADLQIKEQLGETQSAAE